MTLLEERYWESKRKADSRPMSDYLARDQAAQDMSFGILTDQAIEWLRPYSPILEVGSGSGYWAFELQQAGLEVVATDPFPVDKGSTNAYRFNRSWTPVKQLGAVQAVRAYPNHTLLMVWPCYDRDWAYQALLAYSGPTLLYCGEGCGGCCADDKFWDEIGMGWDGAQTHTIPQWAHIHDRLTIYRRKT
jgi:hypothetical protein